MVRLIDVSRSFSKKYILYIVSYSLYVLICTAPLRYARALFEIIVCDVSCAYTYEYCMQTVKRHVMTGVFLTAVSTFLT